MQDGDGCGVAAADLELAVTRYLGKPAISVWPTLDVSVLAFQGEAFAQAHHGFRVFLCLGHRWLTDKSLERTEFEVEHGLLTVSAPATAQRGTRVEVR